MNLNNPMTPDPGDPASVQAPAAPRQKIWTVGTLVYSTTGIVLLFSWLVLGDFAWWMRDRSVGPMASWYLSDLKVPDVIFGLLITSLPAVIQFVVSPIVSVKSDRYRSRLGRRIPFLIVTTVIAMFSMLGLGLTPIVAGSLHDLGAAGTWLHSTLRDLPGGGTILSLLAQEKIVAVGCFAICWTLFEVAQIASRPIFDGLVNDVVPRPLLGRFFGLFRAVGLIDGMIFNFWIMGLVPSHFTLIMTVAGLTYGTSFIWVCLKVKEGEYPPPPPKEEAAPLRGFLVEVRRYFRECFSQPFYLSVFVLIMTAGLCFMPFNIFSLPYAHHVGVDMGTYGKAVALSYFISFCLAYPLGSMADRFHPLRMAGGVLVAFIAVMIWGSFYARTTQTFLVTFVCLGPGDGLDHRPIPPDVSLHLCDVGISGGDRTHRGVDRLYEVQAIRRSGQLRRSGI